MEGPEVRVNRRCADRVLQGHLWVFDNEIKAIDGGYTNGDIVQVVDDRDRFIGKGYINDRSRITIRLLSLLDEDINRGFIHRRIEKALFHRLSLGWSMDGSFRVVFSEGDLLPGLIVDKYEKVLSLQILTLGMERWKEDVVEVLKGLFHPETIIERSDLEVRKKEGLQPRKGILWGKERDRITITLDGLRFEIDLLEGQKTGFYLDQQENRPIIESYVRDRKVLDGFSYSGAFAIYAARYGAKEVISLEDSGKAIEGLKRNVRLNGLEGMIRVEKGDVFDWLREVYKVGERFDCVILDPPSFVKEKGARGGAIRGYKDINLMALRLLNDGGYLITSSCSQNISPTRFLEIIDESARDAGCLVQLLENRFQARDHPILLSMPETHYLKFVVGRKVGK